MPDGAAQQLERCVGCDRQLDDDRAPVCKYCDGAARAKAVTPDPSTPVGDLLAGYAKGKAGAPPVDVAAERAKRQEQHAAEGRAFALQRRTDLLNRAWQTVPKRFRWACFGDQLEKRVTPTTVVQGARQHIVARRGSMILMGPSASGKTSLAVACVRHVLDTAERAISNGDKKIFKFGVNIFFATAYDLAKAGIYSPLGKMPELVDRAMKASLLVLDDLGMDVEVFRQSATSVREVIHERHAQSRPTIVTTYLRRADLNKHYGEGIARRIGEGGVFILGAT